MRYKEYIQKFLQKSLMVYMHYDEELRKIKIEMAMKTDISNLDIIKEETINNSIDNDTDSENTENEEEESN